MRIREYAAAFAETVASKLRRPDFNETGTARGSRFASDAQRVPAVDDDLIASKGVEIYRKMRHDPAVKSALAIKILGVFGKGWDITPDDEAPEDAATEQAAFVKHCLNRMPGSVDDVLIELAMDGHAFGTGIVEKNWGMDTGKYAGKVVLASLKSKDPSIYEFTLDKFNNITKMAISSLGQPVEVDPSKFILFTHNAEHGNPNGTSDLRAAYRYYWIKEKCLTWWAVFLEKYGMPTAKGSYKRGLPKAAQEEFLKVLQSIQKETAIVIPDDVTAELMTANQQITGGGFESLINYCDSQIVKSIVGQTLTTGEGNRVGSMALGKVHEDILTLYIRNLKRRIEEAVDEKLIRDIVDYNFAVRYYPNFVLSLDEKDIVALGDLIYKLITCEEVTPGEDWIREYLGLPARDDKAVQASEVEPETTPDQNRTDKPAEV